ncbi:hypothetical protein PACTADRAFT_48402 [Pachysolen tannophilus NRRL Y-2460]|uniref:SET domain-containing protein n=1 Tax=Pachysolen tannophilus NRRL Y-2460 TaxID=669874 RepID=A0A1E4TXW5_PACTA|nr:hypothetical protein PACTADRAFT_48402 [Pachysolen tannophilus NRRL Y-2460]
MGIKHDDIFEQQQNDNELELTKMNEISPYFKVVETESRGRGCFATKRISKDTLVLKCLRPLSSTVVKPFKKEVCQWCFHYDRGNNMKFKLSNSTKGNFSIFFCSQVCLDEFKKDDYQSIYLNNLIVIEKFFANLKQDNNQETEIKLTSKEDIDNAWKDVEIWESNLPLKESKRLNHLPEFDSDDNNDVYVELKYLSGILFQLYKSQILETDITFMNLELENFQLLQSNEYSKCLKYPYLLQKFIKIYKFVKILFPAEFQFLVNTKFIRSAIGKELGNAFGIWSKEEGSNEFQEYFGYSVYPSASFFNHSCSPNLKRERIGNTLIFKTITDIEKNQELCINYGYNLNGDLLKRQSSLKEWFFDCNCNRCEREKFGNGIIE